VSPSKKSVQRKEYSKAEQGIETPSDGILKNPQEEGEDDHQEEQSDLLISDQSPGVSSR
jgi:hypothetical protein